MSNYDPRSISQMYEQYGKTHGGSSSSGSTYDEVPQTIKQGLGTPLNQSFNTGSDDDDDKPNKTKSFFENVFSWFNASGAEPRKPERYDGSSLYSRDEFKPIKYDPSTNTTSVTGYDPGTPMRSGDDIMTDVDAMLDRSDDAGYTPDPALGSTYDEVKDQKRPPVTIEDAINTAIENTIPTEGYKVQRGDTLSEIAAAIGRTDKELQELNNIKDPRKMQAGSTLRIPVQTAQDKEIVAGATKMSDLKPLRTANQSMMTGDQREYAPETGFEGMGPDPSTGQPVRGLMTPTSPTAEPVDAIEASKAEVREVQKLLGVTADGIIGPNTKRAMASFQYRVGLPVSGNIDTATMEALRVPDSADPRNAKSRINVLNEVGDAPDIDKVKEWAKTNIADPMKAAAFVATVEAETGGRTLVETGYDKERAIEVFVDRNANADGTLGPRMTARKAAIEALPSDYSSDDIFDIVYGNRLGNTEPNDGSKYKGRGLLQITGKTNYKKVGDIIGVDLVANPELVNDPKYAAAAAMAYLSLPGKDYFSKDINQASLAATVGHSDDANNTEAAARFNRAKELKEEMYD